MLVTLFNALLKDIQILDKDSLSVNKTNNMHIQI